MAEPEKVAGLDVTDGTLPGSRVYSLCSGRWFIRKDDTPGSPETVMLTYGYWQRRFGSDRSVIGRGIRVDGKLRERLSA